MQRGRDRRQWDSEAAEQLSSTREKPESPGFALTAGLGYPSKKKLMQNQETAQNKTLPEDSRKVSLRVKTGTNLTYQLFTKALLQNLKPLTKTTSRNSTLPTSYGDAYFIYQYYLFSECAKVKQERIILNEYTKQLWEI